MDFSEASILLHASRDIHCDRLVARKWITVFLSFEEKSVDNTTASYFRCDDYYAFTILHILVGVRQRIFD